MRGAVYFRSSPAVILAIAADILVLFLLVQKLLISMLFARNYS